MISDVAVVDFIALFYFEILHFLLVYFLLLSYSIICSGSKSSGSPWSPGSARFYLFYLCAFLPFCQPEILFFCLLLSFYLRFLTPTHLDTHFIWTDLFVTVWFPCKRTAFELYLVYHVMPVFQLH